MAQRFRLQARNFFLTYPQCPIPKEEVLDQLRQLVSVSSYVVARERHADGAFHIHAFIRSERKMHVRVANFFDLKKDGVTYHGNYQTARSAKCVIEYCKKDRDYLSCIDNFDEMVESVWARALRCDTVSEAIALIRTEKPRDYCLHGEKMIVNLSAVLHMERTVYSTPATYSNFRIPLQMTSWVAAYLSETCPPRPKSLWLIGPSRIGKTSWARSLGTHMFFRNCFNLDKWDSTAAYMVLDDIPWEYIPAKKCLLTGQGEFELTDKYRKKKSVYWDKPTILCLNDLPDCAHDSYWSKNCVIVELTNKLY